MSEASIRRALVPSRCSSKRTLSTTTQLGDKRRSGKSASSGLTARVLARGLSAPALPAVIDSTNSDPLERLLDDYVVCNDDLAWEPADGPSDEQALNPIAHSARSDTCPRRSYSRRNSSTHGTELYSPHEEWCIANLGFTAGRAYVIARAISDRLADKIHRCWRGREECIVKGAGLTRPFALTLDLPPTIRDALAVAYLLRT